MNVLHLACELQHQTMYLYVILFMRKAGADFYAVPADLLAYSFFLVLLFVSVFALWESVATKKEIPSSRFSSD